jgi:hypothetical protein
MNHLLQKESVIVYSDFTDDEVINSITSGFLIKNSLIYKSAYSSTYCIANYLISEQNVQLEDFLI